MSIVFIGHGVQDYSKFAAGAAVLVRIDEWEHVDRLDGVVVHAGRLRDAFSPQQALLLREGPFAADLPPSRAGTVTHLLTGRLQAHEAPDGLQIATRLPSGRTRMLAVMLDDSGFVERIESRPLVWPEHARIAKGIESRFEQAFRDHHETLTSLLYR